MKVLHIIPNLARGGAEAMLEKLLAGIDKDRFQPVVVSLMQGGEYIEKLRGAGVPVHCAGMRRGVPDPLALARLRRIVTGERPDIIHAWMYHASFAALALFARCPVIIAIHHSLHDIDREKPLTKAIIKALAYGGRRAKCIVYCASASQKQHEAIGYARDRGLVIPNGFDCHTLQPSPEQGAQFRAELGLAKDSFVIGHLGRFHPVKDHKALIEAFVEIAAQHPNACLLMAGSGVDYDNELLCKEIIGAKLQDRVHLLGERSDVVRVINSCDVLVNCSRSESFPNVLGEAMACAVPCIATDVGDSAEIVGPTGWTIPARDPGALAEAIATMIKLAPSARSDLGALARSRIVNMYSLGHVISQYERLYEDMVNRQRSRVSETL